MNKKRMKILIIALIGLLAIICSYILFLSKPQIRVKSVIVESLYLYTQPEHIEYIEGDNPVDSIEYFIERNRTYGDNEIQVFMQEDKLPSKEPKDYAKVTMKLEIKNRSIFDNSCRYIMVNDGSNLNDYFLVTKPNVEVYVTERLSTKKEATFEFYIYIKGKSTKEIEKFIRNIEMQFPFSNDMLKNSNQYFSVEDRENIILFEGFQ